VRFTLRTIPGLLVSDGVPAIMGLRVSRLGYAVQAWGEYPIARPDLYA
jgi:hypothetical protein